MKYIFSVVIFLNVWGIFAQTETNIDYYTKKINQLKQETQILVDIQKDYELTIDSLYNLPKTDSLQIVATKLMVDYYVLKTENLRNEMKQMIRLIDALNTIKKED